MEIFKQILFGVAILVAVLFALLVFVTGKGDAMSGGSSVRTTFKGKASFDDFISKLTFYLGIAFMALMISIDVIGNRTGDGKEPLPPPASNSSQPASKPSDTDSEPAKPDTSTTPEKK